MQTQEKSLSIPQEDLERFLRLVSVMKPQTHTKTLRIVIAEHKYCMRVEQLLLSEQDLEDWAATRSLCTSSKPDSALGASALSSCKSQGYRRRSGNKSHKLGKSKNSRVKVGGKKIKGKKYGGPLPDWS
jgi:tRNA A22 N-methylase